MWRWARKMIIFMLRILLKNRKLAAIRNIQRKYECYLKSVLTQSVVGRAHAHMSAMLVLMFWVLVVLLFFKKWQILPLCFLGAVEEGVWLMFHWRPALQRLSSPTSLSDFDRRVERVQPAAVNSSLINRMQAEKGKEEIDTLTQSLSLNLRPSSIM